MPNETLADLLRSVGVQPSAREQYVESTRRPGYVVPRPRPRTMRSPEERMRDLNADVRNQAREQQRAAYASAQSQGALQSRLARSEAYDPGIDPNTGLTQGQEAILGAAEFTGAPSAFRSYDAFANGRPWEGVGHAGLGALAVLGNVGVGASPRLRPQLPRSAAFDAPTRLPVNPPREIAANGLPIRPSEPFRNSLRGGGDDLAEAAGLRPRGLDASARGGEQLGADALRAELRLQGIDAAPNVTALPTRRISTRDLPNVRVTGAEDSADVARYAGLDTDPPPIIVRQVDGRWQMIDGNRRLMAARRTGRNDLEARDATALFARSPFSGAEQMGRAAQASLPDGGARVQGASPDVSAPTASSGPPKPQQTKRNRPRPKPGFFYASEMSIGC